MSFEPKQITSSQPGIRTSRRAMKVAESVAHEIVRDLAGQPVGTSLPGEAQMLAHYGVSRGPLREALRLLEVQGLIAIRPGPGGGPVLLGANPQSLGKMQSLHFNLIGATYAELIAARQVLEPQIARMAADRVDRPPLVALEPFVVVGGDLQEQIDAEYRTSTRPFHAVVASLSGNPVLDVLVASLQQIIITRWRDLVLTDERRRDIVDDHAEIARAILDGDGARAEQLMSDHLTRSTAATVIRGGSDDVVVDWQ
jgi:DNA-binding FadR family transcriptional regulator